jgi:putative transposase
MPEYRRNFVPGGSFFFTVVTANRAPFLTGERARQLLGEAFRETRESWPFTVEALVLLPDHWHAVWTLPEGDAAYPRRLGYLKKEFTKAWLGAGGPEQAVSRSQRRDGRRGVWQRRYWEHTLKDEDDFARHCDYIHYNPVKHGLVACPHQWEWSTFHRWVRAGYLEQDWACCCGGRAPTLPDFTKLDETAME